MDDNYQVKLVGIVTAIRHVEFGNNRGLAIVLDTGVNEGDWADVICRWVITKKLPVPRIGTWLEIDGHLCTTYRSFHHMYWVSIDHYEILRHKSRKVKKAQIRVRGWISVHCALYGQCNQLGAMFSLQNIYPYVGELKEYWCLVPPEKFDVYKDYAHYDGRIYVTGTLVTIEDRDFPPDGWYIRVDQIEPVPEKE